MTGPVKTGVKLCPGILDSCPYYWGHIGTGPGQVWGLSCPEPVRKWPQIVKSGVDFRKNWPRNCQSGVKIDASWQIPRSKLTGRWLQSPSRIWATIETFWARFYPVFDRTAQNLIRYLVRGSIRTLKSGSKSDTKCGQELCSDIWHMCGDTRLTRHTTSGQSVPLDRSKKSKIKDDVCLGQTGLKDRTHRRLSYESTRTNSAYTGIPSNLVQRGAVLIVTCQNTRFDVSTSFSEFTDLLKTVLMHSAYTRVSGPLQNRRMVSIAAPLTGDCCCYRITGVGVGVSVFGTQGQRFARLSFYLFRAPARPYYLFLYLFIHLYCFPARAGPPSSAMTTARSVFSLGALRAQPFSRVPHVHAHTRVPHAQNAKFTIMRFAAEGPSRARARSRRSHACRPRPSARVPGAALVVIADMRFA